MTLFHLLVWWYFHNISASRPIYSTKGAVPDRTWITQVSVWIKPTKPSLPGFSIEKRPSIYHCILQKPDSLTSTSLYLGGIFNLLLWTERISLPKPDCFKQSQRKICPSLTTCLLGIYFRQWPSSVIITGKNRIVSLF